MCSILPDAGRCAASNACERKKEGQVLVQEALETLLQEASGVSYSGRFSFLARSSRSACFLKLVCFRESLLWERNSGFRCRVLGRAMALHAVGQASFVIGASKSASITLPGSNHSFSSTTLQVGFPVKWGSGFQGVPGIRCARVGGVELPRKKRIETALQYIHGVGQTTARQVLLSVGLENKVTAELSEAELTQIRDELSNYMIEGELRRFNALNIKRLVDIQCYRGRRHVLGLPCRGQHTQCNARTRRQGKKRAVAGKKKATKR